MGTVLRFPAERVRGTLYGAIRPEPAEIVILPAIRVERDSGAEEPATSGFDTAASRGGHGRRRRRLRRS